MSSNTEAQALNLTDEQRAEVVRLMDCALMPAQCFADIMEQTQWERIEPTINPWHFGVVVQALLDHARNTMFDSLKADAREAQNETE